MPSIPCEPFTVYVSDESLARLRRKLEDTLLPEADIIDGASWDYGMDLAWLKGLRRHWLEDYDWRKAEKEINSWPNFKARIEDVDLHFIHARSDRADAVPIVLLHGWPGSFYEFHKIIEELRSPTHGTSPAFHVVIPSVPGFGFSSTPRSKGWTIKDSARVIDTLMSDALGYKSYLAQGGDWGSMIATLLSAAPHCKLVHLNMCVVQPPYPMWLVGLLAVFPKWLSLPIARRFLSDEDLRQLGRSKDFAMGAGYFLVQHSQPLTIGLALNDSPIGLLAWVGSKYHTHVDPRTPLSVAELLTTLSIYFHTHTFASSCLPYHENDFKAPIPPVKEARLGVSVFDHDILVMPQRWVRSYHGKSLVFHRVHPTGGHFPALDNPEGLVADLREFAGDNKDVFAAYTDG